MLPCSLGVPSLSLKLTLDEEQANGLATRCPTGSALAAGLFRCAHPGHLGLRGGWLGYAPRNLK
jgi:hypothetical protein